MCARAFNWAAAGLSRERTSSPALLRRRDGRRIPPGPEGRAKGGETLVLAASPVVGGAWFAAPDHSAADAAAADAKAVADTWEEGATDAGAAEDGAVASRGEAAAAGDGPAGAIFSAGFPEAGAPSAVLCGLKFPRRGGGPAAIPRAGLESPAAIPAVVRYTEAPGPWVSPGFSAMPEPCRLDLFSAGPPPDCRGFSRGFSRGDASRTARAIRLAIKASLPVAAVAGADPAGPPDFPDPCSAAGANAACRPAAGAAAPRPAARASFRTAFGPLRTCRCPVRDKRRFDRALPPSGVGMESGCASVPGREEDLGAFRATESCPADAPSRTR